MEIILHPENKIMTDELQAAIDACFLAGGGRIVLEDGVYNTGGLRLRSGCTLYLRSGATLKGVREIDAYDVLKKEGLEPIKDEYRTDAVWLPVSKRLNADHITRAASRWNNALIRILDAHDVAIIGEKGSIIDGSDPYDEIGEQHYRGPHGIAYHHSHSLKFCGYTIKSTGNWAHLGYFAQDIEYKDITVLGGHDGIHNSSCDRFRIEDCEFYTGDDCIAGFDNYEVTVKGCVLNSACSGMRFGGADILVENCHFYGPARYFFRGSISVENKMSGNSSPEEGRKNMLALFTYYSDFTLKVRRDAKNILIRNCKVENCDRFLHFDFTGTHRWQKNRPLCSISFENISATGIKMPLNAYGDREEKLTLSFKDCDIAFTEPVECAIRAGNFRLISAERLTLTNVSGALVRCYGESGEIRAEELFGPERLAEHTDEPFSSDDI